MYYPLSPNSEYDTQSNPTPYIEKMQPFNSALPFEQPVDAASQNTFIKAEANRLPWSHMYTTTPMTPVDKIQQNTNIQSSYQPQLPVAFTHTSTAAAEASSPMSTPNGTPSNPLEVMNWPSFPCTDYVKHTDRSLQQYKGTPTYPMNNAYTVSHLPQQSAFYGVPQDQDVISTGAVTMPVLCNALPESANPKEEPPSSSMVSSWLSSDIEKIGCVSGETLAATSTIFGNLSNSNMMHAPALKGEYGHSSSVLNWVAEDSSRSTEPKPRDDDVEQDNDLHLCRWANCCFTAISLDKLITHVREMHIGGGKAAYHCEWLGCARNKKPFMKRHKMHNHLRTHTGERPFVCTVADCEKRFSRPDSLNTHIRTHSNFRPYVCPVENCTKAYFHSRSLRKHVKGHEAAGVVVPRPAPRTPAVNKKKHASASPNQPDHGSPITSFSSSSSPSPSSSLSPASISVTIPLSSPSIPHYLPSFPQAAWVPQTLIVDTPHHPPPLSHDYTSYSSPFVASSPSSTHTYAPAFPGASIGTDTSKMTATTDTLTANGPFSYVYTPSGYYYYYNNNNSAHPCV